VDTVYNAARRGDLDRLAAAALDGTLPDTTGRRYELDDGPRAYADLMHTHVRGKLVVVTCDDHRAGRWRGGIPNSPAGTGVSMIPTRLR
jgi:hypothetical protein